MRADPEEEYFRLTCLAHKIQQSENDTDLTVFNVSVLPFLHVICCFFQISEAKLFRNLKRKNIAFHLWHSWIGDQFTKVRKLSQKAKERHCPYPEMLQKQKEANSNNGAQGNGIMGWFSSVFTSDERNGQANTSDSD